MLAINQHVNLISMLNLMHLVSFERDVDAVSKICGWRILTHTPASPLLSAPKTPFHSPWLGQSISSSSLSSKETQRRNEFNPRKGKTQSPYQRGPVSQQVQQNHDWTASLKQCRICHVLLIIMHFFTSQTAQHKIRKTISAEAEEQEVFSGSPLPSQQSWLQKHQQNNRWM